MQDVPAKGSAWAAPAARRSDRRDRLSSVEKGRIGERRAAEFLQDRGYRIVERNVRTHAGEIDLIAAGVDGSIVFVEVKAWGSFDVSDLAAVVNDRKRLRIARAAAAFLAANPRYGRLRPRFDVLLLRAGRPPLHLQSAFGADGRLL